MMRHLTLCLGLLCACDSSGSTDPCAAKRCTTTPPAACDGTVRTVFQALGTCTPDPGAPTDLAICNYPVAQRQDCALLGNKICQSGQCIEVPITPCAGIVCDQRPAPDCQGNLARIFKNTGTCNPATPPAGACEYGLEATLDCAASALVCKAGGCVDPAATPCDPNPCDVPPPGSCLGNTPTLVGAGTCATKTVAGKPAAECTYPTSAAPACTGATVECYVGMCARGLLAPHLAGDLVITEVMKNPAATGDESEWIELFNPRDVAAKLDDCVLSDDGGEAHTIGAGVTVPSGGYLVLGKSADWALNGGFVPDYVYADYTLANSADEIILTCAGVVIDRLLWTDLWPSQAGASLNLGTNPPDATANDFRGAWCDATARYGDGTNLGSPRRQNPACPTP